MIQGFAISYDGRLGSRPTAGFKYLNPFLSTSRRVFAELNSDQRAFENLIVDTSQLSGALAERAPRHLRPGREPRPDDERDRRPQASSSPRRSRCCPTSCASRTRRSSTSAPRSTTSTRSSTPRSRWRASCSPFLASLRAASADAVPDDHATSTQILAPPGRGERPRRADPAPAAARRRARSARARPTAARTRPDLADSPRPQRQRLHPGRVRRGGLRAAQLRAAARRCSAPTRRSWSAGSTTSATPATSTRSAASGAIETTFNPFSLSAPGGLPTSLDPLTAERAARPRSTTGNTRRCPGGNERPVNDIDPSDDSVPFTDGGALTDGAPGDCDPSQTPPGHEADRSAAHRADRRRRSPALATTRRRRRHAHLRDRDVQRVRDRPGLGRADRRASTPARSPTSTSTPQKRARRHGRALRRARDARQGHEVLVRAAVADRRVLHLLRARRAAARGPGRPRHRVPASQVSQTVQNDLVQNTLREPFKQRLPLLINEFGTALAGNPDSLNQAIRLGAPALTQLHKVHARSSRSQNRIITRPQRQLRPGDRQARCAPRGRRQVHPARRRDTADASAARREDLSRDFEILDDFLAELQPTLAKLDDVAQTRHAAAHRPARRGARAQPPRAQPAGLLDSASDASLDQPRRRSTVGEQALRRGADEIRRSPTPAQKAPTTGEILADFLRDLDDPRRAVEIDDRVPEDTGRDDPRPGQKDTKGYTGPRGPPQLRLLPDRVRSTSSTRSATCCTSRLYYIFTGPCGAFSTRPRPADRRRPGVPAEGGGTTTEHPRRRTTASPGSARTSRASTRSLDLPPYDPSVCPNGTRSRTRPRRRCAARPAQATAAHERSTSRPAAATHERAAAAPAAAGGGDRRRQPATGGQGGGPAGGGNAGPTSRTTSSTRSSTCRRACSTTCRRASRTSSASAPTASTGGSAAGGGGGGGSGGGGRRDRRPPRLPASRTPMRTQAPRGTRRSPPRRRWSARSRR